MSDLTFTVTGVLRAVKMPLQPTPAKVSLQLTVGDDHTATASDIPIPDDVLEQWTMIGSRWDRVHEFYDQLRRIAARRAQQIRGRYPAAVDDPDLVPFTPWGALAP